MKGKGTPPTKHAVFAWVRGQIDALQDITWRRLLMLPPTNIYPARQHRKPQQQRDGRPRGTRKHVRRRRARRRPHRSPRPPARAILTRRPSPRPKKSGSHDRLRDLRNRAGSAVCAAAVPRTPPRASRQSKTSPPKSRDSNKPSQFQFQLQFHLFTFYSTWSKKQNLATKRHPGRRPRSAREMKFLVAMVPSLAAYGNSNSYFCNPYMNEVSNVSVGTHGQWPHACESLLPAAAHSHASECGAIRESCRADATATLIAPQA